MNLTDEEIRIKVAKSIGWVDIWKRQCGHNLGAPGAFDWVGREKPGGAEYVLPNYPEDLNACAEFEKTLTNEELWQIDAILFNLPDCRAPFVATARQRCLAYLKTKGLIP